MFELTGIDVAERVDVGKVELDDVITLVGARGYSHRENSSWKRTSVWGAGEVPTLGAGTAGGKAEVATAAIGVCSGGADTDRIGAATVGKPSGVQ